MSREIIDSDDVVYALRGIENNLERIADALDRIANGPTDEERAKRRDDLRWELSQRASFENERRAHEIARRM